MGLVPLYLHSSHSSASCANTTEPIQMQFGMLSGGSRGYYYMGCRCPHGKGHYWGCMAD